MNEYYTIVPGLECRLPSDILGEEVEPDMEDFDIDAEIEDFKRHSEDICQAIKKIPFTKKPHLRIVH